MTALILFVGLCLVWVVNFIVILIANPMSKICENYIQRCQFDMVDDVFAHYDTTKLSSWFGFKCWFVSYEMKGKENV